MAFDAAEMEDLAAFSAREVKKVKAEERERQVFLCRRTVEIKVKSSHPSKLSEN